MLPSFNRNTGNFPIPGPSARNPPQALIGPELPSAAGNSAVAAAAAAASSSSSTNTKGNKNKKNLRMVAGSYWEDATLDDWPENDFRVFCGDLGNEVTDDLLANAFRKFKSFQKAKVIRDKRTGKTKGYGFVSFAHPEDMVAALKEINGKYVGNRPIRLKKSDWQKRNVESEHNKNLMKYETIVETKSKSLKKFKKIKKKGPDQVKAVKK